MDASRSMKFNANYLAVLSEQTLSTIQTQKQNTRIVAVEVFGVIYTGHHCHDMLPQRIAGRAGISRRMKAYFIGLHICG